MPDDSEPRTKYFRPASLERTLSRLDGGDDVKRQALQLQAEVERDQVAGRDHQHHAGTASSIRTGYSKLKQPDAR